MSVDQKEGPTVPQGKFNYVVYRGDSDQRTWKILQSFMDHDCGDRSIEELKFTR